MFKFKEITDGEKLKKEGKFREVINISISLNDEGKFLVTKKLLAKGEDLVQIITKYPLCLFTEAYAYTKTMSEGKMNLNIWEEIARQAYFEAEKI